MNLLVVDEAYPSDSNLYGDVFVHQRVKHYLARGHEVRVTANFKGERHRDQFDGVGVDRLGAIGELTGILDEWRPDAALVHFPTFPFIKFFEDYPQLPIVAWVHGFEALGWYRRLFNLERDPIHFARYIKGNLIQLYHFRHFVRRSNAGAPIHFVFVSNWMRRIAETDSMISIQRSDVIPNPIDDHVFGFAAKPPGQRPDVLVIRPFGGRKYATDIIHSAVRLLADRGRFAGFQFTFAGCGVSGSPLAREFGHRDNVKLIDSFLTQAEIVALHREHGIFLCPTRQDAQGVSMCEAMASGLVPVASNNTAIPEFVSDGESGILCENRPEQFADALLRLADDPDLFARLSAGAARSIRDKAGIDKVTDEELRLVETVARWRTAGGLD